MTERELLTAGLRELQSVRLQRTTYCAIPRFCAKKTRL